jgi:hypothetical protein
MTATIAIAPTVQAEPPADVDPTESVDSTDAEDLKDEESVVDEETLDDAELDESSPCENDSAPMVDDLSNEGTAAVESYFVRDPETNQLIEVDKEQFDSYWDDLDAGNPIEGEPVEFDDSKSDAETRQLVKNPPPYDQEDPRSAVKN